MGATRVYPRYAFASLTDTPALPGSEPPGGAGRPAGGWALPRSAAATIIAASPRAVASPVSRPRCCTTDFIRSFPLSRGETVSGRRPRVTGHPLNRVLYGRAGRGQAGEKKDTEVGTNEWAMRMGEGRGCGDGGRDRRPRLDAGRTIRTGGGLTHESVPDRAGRVLPARNRADHDRLCVAWAGVAIGDRLRRAGH